MYTCSQPYRWKQTENDTHTNTGNTSSLIIFHPGWSGWKSTSGKYLRNTDPSSKGVPRHTQPWSDGSARTVPRGAPFLWVDYWGYYLPPTNVSLNSSVFAKMNLLAHNFTWSRAGKCQVQATKLIYSRMLLALYIPCIASFWYSQTLSFLKIL